MKNRKKEHSFLEDHSVDSESHVAKMQRSKSIKFKSKSVKKQSKLKHSKSEDDEPEKVD